MSIPDSKYVTRARELALYNYNGSIGDRPDMGEYTIMGGFLTNVPTGIDLICRNYINGYFERIHSNIKGFENLYGNKETRIIAIDMMRKLMDTAYISRIIGRSDVIDNIISMLLTRYIKGSKNNILKTALTVLYGNKIVDKAFTMKTIPDNLQNPIIGVKTVIYTHRYSVKLPLYFVTSDNDITSNHAKFSFMKIEALDMFEAKKSSQLDTLYLHGIVVDIRDFTGPKLQYHEDFPSIIGNQLVGLLNEYIRKNKSSVITQKVDVKLLNKTINENQSEDLLFPGNELLISGPNVKLFNSEYIFNNIYVPFAKSREMKFSPKSRKDVIIQFD